MKKVIGLRSPAVDIIGDVNENSNNSFVIIRNPCIFTWSGEHMKVIPFEACSKENEMKIPNDNIAWSYEVDKKIAKYHTQISEEKKARGCELKTKEEYEKYLASKQQKVANTLKKVK